MLSSIALCSVCLRHPDYPTTFYDIVLPAAARRCYGAAPGLPPGLTRPGLAANGGLGYTPAIRLLSALFKKRWALRSRILHNPTNDFNNAPYALQNICHNVKRPAQK